MYNGFLIFWDIPYIQFFESDILVLELSLATYPKVYLGTEQNNIG